MSTNPVIAILTTYLTQPASDYYLSKLIGGSTNPKLEPFTDASVNLGTQNLGGINTALSLSNVVVSGLSNIMIPSQSSIVINGDQASFTADMPNTQSPPAGVPSQLTMSATLNVNPQGSEPFTAGISATVNTTTIKGVFTATSANGKLDQATVTFNSVNIDAAATTSNVKIKVKVDSPFQGILQGIIESDPIIEKIMSEVNSQVNQPSVLDALSSYCTQEARGIHIGA